jgi:predicted nuclease of restriction endonuclease-like (RecB) superfamily
MKKTNLINKMIKYTSLVQDIGTILEQGRKQVYIKINNILVKTYFEIGYRIVEFEQKGDKRAEYGSNLLKNLSEDLTKGYGKGFSVQNLENMRKFYLYKGISQTVSGILPKSQTPSRISDDFKLSWSHYIRLMAIKNPDERKFYEIECIENNWSIRELNRQFDSSLYERLVLSKKDKNEIKKLSEKGQIIEKIQDSLKEPLILEFLGLDENSDYSEKDIETGIINNLEKFLLELGKGFTFVSRQKRITNGSDHYFIDLVFYNRLLKCFVLIDLKIGKIKHQDVGQIQMYVNYFDREVKTDEENQTIGIILCKQGDEFIVKYTLPEKNKQIFAKEYKLYLPKKEEIEKEVRKFFK